MSVSFIHEVVSRGGTVLVNCSRGLSRSASCVLAYLIRHQDMSLDQVICLDRPGTSHSNDITARRCRQSDKPDRSILMRDLSIN